MSLVNLNNFFNLITGRGRETKSVKDTDVIIVGRPNDRAAKGFTPVGMRFKDLKDTIVKSISSGGEGAVKNYTEAKILLNVNDLTPNTYTTNGVTELINDTGNTFQVKREGAGRYLLKIADEVLPLDKIYWNMPVMAGEEANIAKLNARPIAFNNETFLIIYVWNNANLFSDFIINYGNGGWLPIEIQIFD